MPDTKKREIDLKTKDAWEKNWAGVSMDRIMEIFDYVRVKKQMEIFLRVLPKNEKILEGGCGLAPYLLKLREIGYDVEGVDYNEGPIRKVLERHPGLPVRVGDVTAIPYPDETFGGYLSLGVIEHFIEGPEKALREAWRVLKPGGIFIVAVPVWNVFAALSLPWTWLKANPWLRRVFRKSEAHHYWEQYFKRAKLERYLKEAGFRVQEVHPLDHSHALASFSRFFRDPSKYDEANPLALRVAEMLEKYFPWQTAAQMTFVCRKKGRP